MNDPAVILALHSLLVHSIRCSRPIVFW